MGWSFRSKDGVFNPISWSHSKSLKWSQSLHLEANPAKSECVLTGICDARLGRIDAPYPNWCRYRRHPCWHTNRWFRSDYTRWPACRLRPAGAPSASASSAAPRNGAGCFHVAGTYGGRWNLSFSFQKTYFMMSTEKYVVKRKTIKRKPLRGSNDNKISWKLSQKVKPHGFHRKCILRIRFEAEEHNETWSNPNCAFNQQVIEFEKTDFQTVVWLLGDQ